jgi:hypothetical protein
MAALVTLLPLALCLFVLVLNGAVGLAQEPSPETKKKETNIVRLDRARRLAYHTRFLRQVAKSGPLIEVVWDLEKVYPALRFIAEYGSEKANDAAKAIGSIFARTENTLARDLCLSALKRIGSKVARREMLRIYNDSTVPSEWRAICAEYLGMPSLQGSKADSTSTRSPKTISP